MYDTVWLTQPPFLEHHWTRLQKSARAIAWTRTWAITWTTASARTCAWATSSQKLDRELLVENTEFTSMTMTNWLHGSWLHLVAINVATCNWPTCFERDCSQAVAWSTNVPCEPSKARAVSTDKSKCQVQLVYFLRKPCKFWRNTEALASQALATAMKLTDQWHKHA